MTPPPRKDQYLPPWIEIEAAEKKRRKPGPKPKVSPEKVRVVKPPKVHVKVNLTGSVEFDLEGQEAAKLVELLKGMKLDEVIEFVDPWASGAEIRYDVEVIDGPMEWEANETTGTVESRQPYWPLREFR